jgi:Spy/CpxP family protein refolding chaperone
MKNLRLLAVAGLAACCIVLFGSQSNTYAQGRSGKSGSGKATMGKTRSTNAIQRGIDRMTTRRSQINRDSDRDMDDSNRMSNSRNRRNRMRTNNGVRDYGRGIGRGKGQGKGRGFAKRSTRHRKN